MLRRALAVSVALWALTIGVASASVSVHPPTVEVGAPAELSLRVTQDRADVETTKVELELPKDIAVGGVTVRALPGWSHTVEQSTITWSGGAITTGEYVDFDVAIRAVPDVDRLAITATQTDDDGKVLSTPLQLAVTRATYEHRSGRNGLAVLAIVLACVGIVLAAVAYMTRRTNPADGPDQAPLP